MYHPLFRRLCYIFILSLLAHNKTAGAVDPTTRKNGPNLHELLSIIENCDLKILHEGGESFNFIHFHFIPTTITELRRNKDFPINDVYQVRQSHCAIVYIFLNPLNSDRSSIHWPDDYGEIALVSQKYGSGSKYRYETKILKVAVNLFFLLFSNHRKIVQSTIQHFYDWSFEILGIVEIKEDDTLQICIAIQSFKIQTDSTQICFPVRKGSNGLQILKENRNSPKLWSTRIDFSIQTGIPGGLAFNYVQTLSINPFDPAVNKFLLVWHLILNVFLKCNSSLTQTDINSGKSEFGSETLNIDVTNALIIHVFSGYNFLTCYSTQAITFDFYVTPFQPEVWIALLAVFALLAIFTATFMKGLEHNSSFCCWLFLLGALIEDGFALPGNLKRKTTLRLFLGAWILGGVFLSNCYNGLMISELNSPLSRTTVKTFRDLVCTWQDVQHSWKEYRSLEINTTTAFGTNFNYHGYREYLAGLLGNGGNFKNFGPSTCFSFLSFPNGHNELSSEFFAFLSAEYMAYMGDIGQNRKQYELGLNLLHPNQRTLPTNLKNFSKLSRPERIKVVEKQVVSCGKTVFIASTRIQRAEIEYLSKKYSWIKFYKNKETFRSFPSTFSLKNPGISRVPLQFRVLFESGIYGRLEREFDLRANFKRERAVEHPPPNDNMTMDGCIVTLFILSAGIAGVGLIVFCIENRKMVGGDFCRRVPPTIFRFGRRVKHLFSTKSVVKSFGE